MKNILHSLGAFGPQLFKILGKNQNKIEALEDLAKKIKLLVEMQLTRERIIKENLDKGLEFIDKLKAEIEKQKF